MALATSKITAQGQVSVPAEIRRRLGLGPGATLEWDEQDGQIVVRRRSGPAWPEIRLQLFPKGPPIKAATIAEMDDAIGDSVLERYERAVVKRDE